MQSRFHYHIKNLKNIAHNIVVPFILVASVLLCMSFGPYFYSNPVGYLDPWYYLTYFLNPQISICRWDGLYYTSRLPHILPSALWYQLFQPAFANKICNFSTLLMMTVSLYVFSERRILDAIICSLWVFIPANIASVVWDYPDGTAIAWGIAGLAFCTFQPKKEYQKIQTLQVAAGFCFWSSFTTVNTTIIPIAGICFSTLIFSQKKGLIPLISSWFLGGVISFIIWAFSSKLLGGSFMYFWPQIVQSYWTLTSGHLDSIVSPVSNWLPKRTALLLPFLSVFPSLFFLRKRESPSGSKSNSIVMLSNVITATLLIWVGLIQNRGILETHYQASYWIITFIPAIVIATKILFKTDIQKILLICILGTIFISDWKMRYFALCAIVAAYFSLLFIKKIKEFPKLNCMEIMSVLAQAIAVFSLSFSIELANKDQSLTYAKTNSTKSFNEAVSFLQNLKSQNLLNRSRIRGIFSPQEKEKAYLNSFCSLFLWGSPEAEYSRIMTQKKDVLREDLSPSKVCLFFSNTKIRRNFICQIERSGKHATEKTCFQVNDQIFVSVFEINDN